MAIRTLRVRIFTVKAPSSYTITLTKLVQVGSGTVLQYEISSVTNNGATASFKNFSYNGGTYWNTDKTILARDVKETVTTAKITLKDGSTVDAKVLYAEREI